MFCGSGRIVIAFILALAPGLAFAQSEPLAQRVAFNAGRAAIKGHIKGREFVDYVFPAGAGESLKVSLKTNNDGNYFNLLAPGETDVAFFVGQNNVGQAYEGVAPTSGDYKARVYLVRSAARRGEAANYTLTIALGAASVTDEKGPDYADGLTGGPDFWEVTGVEAGDTLNLRKEPSPHGNLVARFANGAVLRNQGCKNTRGQRWCRVERPDDPSIRGWVNGRYLREAGGPR
jgi:Bacterial SH3 domain